MKSPINVIRLHRRSTLTVPDVAAEYGLNMPHWLWTGLFEPHPMYLIYEEEILGKFPESQTIGYFQTWLHCSILTEHNHHSDVLTPEAFRLKAGPQQRVAIHRQMPPSSELGFIPKMLGSLFTFRYQQVSLATSTT
ncbi:hypothetical protein VTL71DRAFT_4042, partial [Oculimacula yallundae]